MTTDPQEPEIRLWMRLASFGYFGLVLLLYGSSFAGFALQSQAAALLALAGFVAMFTVHLVVSVVVYRQIMRRPWPDVDPLADEDDWDAA